MVKGLKFGFRLIGFSILAGLLMSFTIAPLAFLASSAINNFGDTINSDIKDLSQIKVSEVSELYANDNTTKLASFYTENRIVVPFEKISDYMKKAMISHEDKNFYSHGGIDIIGTLRAAITTYFGHGQVSGGSGITQQYVKNMLIYERLQNDDPIGAYNARVQNLMRKIREAKQAIELETKMTKDEILTGYLNVSPFGQNIYGVEAASQRFFSKHASELNIVEAATLAGIPQNPNILDPLASAKDSLEKCEAQRNIVLGQMLENGYITQDQYDKSIKTSLKSTLKPKALELGCEAAKSAAYFCDYVKNEILENPIFGATDLERQKFLFTGGLKIYSTLDPKIQKAAQKSINKVMSLQHLGNPNYLGAASALSSVEPGTGKIIAMAQSKKFNPGASDNPADTAINYNSDQVHGGSSGFPPGSTFKVFELASWIDKGYSLNTQISSIPRTFTADEFGPCAAGNLPWKPTNAYYSTPNPQTVFGATQWSSNLPFVNMATRLGLCDITAYALKMGYKIPIAGSEPINAPVNAKPSMLLGSTNASPLNMAESYATVASGGVHCDAIAINKIIGKDGKEIAVPNANCIRVLPEETAKVLQYLLQTVAKESPDSAVTQVANRTGGVTWDSKRDVGIKTGTSDMNKHIWAITIVPQLATAVWSGNPNQDTYMDPYYSFSLPLPINIRFLNEAMKGKPYMDFIKKLPEKYTVYERYGRFPNEEQTTTVTIGSGDNCKMGPDEDTEDRTVTQICTPSSSSTTKKDNSSSSESSNSSSTSSTNKPDNSSSTSSKK